jgi:hypothetical protein
MSSSVDPLPALIALVAADPSVALIASVAAVVLSLVCALLAWRQQSRLAAVQIHLDKLSSAIRSFESDYERLLIRSLNLPSSLKAPRSSSLSPDAVEEKATVPTLLDEKTTAESALFAGAPKHPPNKSGG